MEEIEVYVASEETASDVIALCQNAYSTATSEEHTYTQAGCVRKNRAKGDKNKVYFRQRGQEPVFLFGKGF